MIILASEGCFWPLTASMTSEVKNNYAYNIPHDICNKFIEVKFFVTSWGLPGSFLGFLGS